VLTVAADGATMHFQRRTAPPNKEPIEQSETLTRIGEPGPSGAHAISGHWSFPVEEEPTSFYISGNTLARKDAEGTSYTANLDGSEAPYDGHPGMTVSVKVTAGRTLEQTNKQDGKVFSVEHFTVDKDTRTLHIRYEFPGGKVTKQTAHRETSVAPTP